MTICEHVPRDESPTRGERQVEKHDLVLVSGNGGILNYHSTTILSKHLA